jgi:glycosyltransferase involved in cell wall biosynthesis
MDMTTGHHARWAALFARYIHRPFFSIVPTSRVYTKRYTPLFWITKRFLHHAAQLFVSSDYIKMRISTRYHISQDRITVATPPIDPELFVHTHSDTTITIDHQGYNFFISSYIETLSELRSFLAVYTRVETRYPRTGGIVFVDAHLYKAATRLVHRKKMRGIFIHTRDDQFLPQLKASQVYLSVSKTSDINMPLLQALSLQVPVVTIGSGITADLFKDSLYERFLSYTDDPELLAHSIITLMEDHLIRLDYSINTKLLLNKASMGTAIDYATMLYLVVVQHIDPLLYEELTKKQ